MADAPTKRKRAPADGEPWSLGEALGLIEDDGWVSALRVYLQDASPETQQTWGNILKHCLDVFPQSGKGWLESENEAESKCGHPPMGFPGEEPKPDPGTVNYQLAVAAAAPSVGWLGQIRTAIQTPETRSSLARVVSAALKSGVGTLNRNGPNKEILRGLIWSAAAVGDSQCIEALRQVATWSVEHKTAQAKTIGIALAFLGSELSAAALRMISEAAKRPSPKTRFARYATHVEGQIGLSKEESAERFIPTFDLDATGVRRIECGADGALELFLNGTSAEVRFRNGSGKSVNSLPAAIRRNHAAVLTEIRSSAKALAKLLATQRGRIESLLFEEREWRFASWAERYLAHPVVGTLTRRLIWTVDDCPVVFHAGEARDVHGERVDAKPESCVRLWHPIRHSAEAVHAWRHVWESSGLAQPFKQAHREIYLLTEAERQTHTYSNRFAAHILNQSQFRALALARQWERPFIGGWGGEENVAKRILPGNWRVEFWLEGVGDEYGPTGALLHVATDQVRFYVNGEADPAPLERVPPLIFSEAMRDVDLFVGVASVGNNPEWSDGGPQARYREYWQSYSFGDLSVSAKSRRDILQRLVPKLKIASQCSLDEKFLLVRGQLRTYKIHLGSGNILMEPNDQYLCIVPKQTEAQGSVLLPFEGDRTLSVILSKAFLLAVDYQITDETITRQIRPK